MEQMYIKAIKASILKLKNGGLNDTQRGIAMKKAGTALTALKKVNEPMYDDYIVQYKNVLK